MIGIKKKLIFQFIFSELTKRIFCVKSAGKYFEVSLSNSICSFLLRLSEPPPVSADARCR